MEKILNTFILLFIINVLSAQNLGEIKFENHSWMPTPIDQFGSWDMGEGDVFDDHYIRMIQFQNLPSVEVIDQLKDQGIELLDYYTNNTYMARIASNADYAELSRQRVLGISSLPWKVKVSKDILAGDIGDWALQGSRVSIVLMYYKGTNTEMLRQDLQSMGVTIHQIFEDYALIKANVDLKDLYALAEKASIRYLTIESEPGVPEDVEGRSLHRSNMINSMRDNGLKYNGSGVPIQVRDDGTLGPHIDFHGRIMLNAFGDINTQHMDMVGGIFAGAGNIDPRVGGMASGSDIYATNYVADFLDNTLALHQEEGVLVTNSSYSNGCNAGYTQITWTVDRQISQNPSLLHVFSAGNSNGNTCGGSAYGAGGQWANITGGHKVAKNVIATANLRLDVSLETSSSRGPASDGRLKPDLSARGTAQMSTDPNNLYGPGGGTSAAAPGVAGVCAQLFEAYRDLNGGETPESALIKASLMNTANDLGNVGPDFYYGFGHMNAGRAYKLLEEKRYLKAEVQPGDVNTHQFEVEGDVKEVRFMLYWKEPEGAVGGTQALVNDLDLTVDFNGETFYPLVLDPTPVADSLNKPAVPGVDRLNNVEQVVFKSEIGGSYEVKVSGTTLPFGSREYYILIEEKENEVDLTYPFGGEGLEPGTTEQIHWDATEGTEDFFLEYSSDNGTNWTQIGRASALDRTYNWIVPQAFTAEGIIRVSRGTASSANEVAFNVAPVPESLLIKRVCPDFIELDWEAVEEGDEYEVYILGDKFMEIVTRVDTNFAMVAVEDVLADHWFSVRAITENGAVGRRMNAVNYADGLDDCVANTDIQLVEILQPNPYLVYSCGEFDEAVVVRVSNIGTQAISDVSVEYDLGNGIQDAETFNVTLNPGESTELTFTSALVAPTSGEYELEVTASTMGDELIGNNSIVQPFELNNLVGGGAVAPFTEDFQASSVIPADWHVTGTFEGVKWELTTVAGPNGGNTRAITLGSRTGSEIASIDEIYSEPIDLSQLTKPALKFDYASSIATIPAEYNGNIQVVVYSFCEDRSFESIFSADLGSFITETEYPGWPFEPTSSNDWDEVILDLSPFAGSRVVVGWVVQNDFNFNIYIDNINIDESNIEFPNVDLTASNTRPCRLFDPVEFEVPNPTPNVEYTWAFGDRANPRTALGAGPHSVRFFDSGVYTINVAGKDLTTNVVVQKSLTVEAFERPSASFTSEVTNLTVEFTNNSTSALSYLWDFGDGNTSMDVNPTHTYLSMGEYEVTLSATNQCTTRERRDDIEVGTVSADDLSLDQLTIFPNPASDVLLLRNINPQLDGQWNILDLTGKNVNSGKLQGVQQKQINISDLIEGAYLLQVQLGDAVKSYRIVKI